MAHHYWIAPCLLANRWKLKVPRSLVLLPETDLFFLVTMEKQWVFNMAPYKIPCLGFLHNASYWGTIFHKVTWLCSGMWEAQDICAPFFSGDELASCAWIRTRLPRMGPKDLHSLLCDTVERAWDLIRKRDVNPCSATYWPWAGCFSPLGLSFPIYKAERVIPSVCLPPAESVRIQRDGHGPR